MALLSDLTDFVQNHSPHGLLSGDATTPVACPRGVTFERWVTPWDAEVDLLRAASLN